MNMVLETRILTRVTIDLVVSMGYRPSVRSRWLDIGQVLFLCVFMDRDEVEVRKLVKKRTNKLGQ